MSSEPQHPWLESDEEFEGVGAHRLNGRYDPVDEDDPEELARTAGRRLTQHSLTRAPLIQTATPTPDVGLYVRRLDGIDCSHYQPDAGPVDLAAVRRIPTRWIAWKATQSVSYVDATFKGVRAEMRHLDFDHRLFYHWLSSTRDADEQAAHYLRTIGPWAPGEGVMLDAEEAGITEAGCLAWLERVEQTTHRPSAVYTGLYVSSGTIWRSHLIRHSRYGPRPMHLAAYVTRDNLLSRMKTLAVLDLSMHAWQFSSNGPVAGITGRCDMNTVISRSSYDAACAVTAPTMTIEHIDGPSVIVRPTNQEGDDMRIITNRDAIGTDAPPSMQWAVGQPAGALKFGVAFAAHEDPPRYRLINLTPAEVEALGAPQPVSLATIAALGSWTPPKPTDVAVTGASRYRAVVGTVDLIPVES